MKILCTSTAHGIEKMLLVVIGRLQKEARFEPLGEIQKHLDPDLTTIVAYHNPSSLDPSQDEETPLLIEMAESVREQRPDIQILVLSEESRNLGLPSVVRTFSTDADGLSKLLQAIDPSRILRADA